MSCQPRCFFLTVFGWSNTSICNQDIWPNGVIPTFRCFYLLNFGGIISELNICIFPNKFSPNTSEIFKILPIMLHQNRWILMPKLRIIPCFSK